VHIKAHYDIILTAESDSEVLNPAINGDDEDV
jgi:hypothetical protein